MTADTTLPRSRLVPIADPFDLVSTLRPLLRGRGDPTMRISRGGVSRATRTPEGPTAMQLERVPGGVRITAWGPGAGWAIDHAAALLGADDDPTALRTMHPLLRRLQVRLAGLRIGRTDAVFEALVPAILEQKVTGEQARAGFRGLVRDWGEAAPGPTGLRLPPTAARLAGLPSYALHPLGIERRRAETLRRAARLGGRLEGLTAGPPEAATTMLRSIPGIGAWTAAEVVARALGDPDAVSVGDFHLPHLVCWALAREPRGTDERMLELLEPYRGQRGRVIRLLETAGLRAPAHGPRLAPRRIEAD